MSQLLTDQQVATINKWFTSDHNDISVVCSFDFFAISGHTVYHKITVNLKPELENVAWRKADPIPGDGRQHYTFSVEFAHDILNSFRHDHGVAVRKLFVKQLLKQFATNKPPPVQPPRQIVAPIAEGLRPHHCLFRALF